MIPMYFFAWSFPVPTTAQGAPHFRPPLRSCLGTSARQRTQNGKKGDEEKNVRNKKDDSFGVIERVV